jgi:hypothetical protein
MLPKFYQKDLVTKIFQNWRNFTKSPNLVKIRKKLSPPPVLQSRTQSNAILARAQALLWGWKLYHDALRCHFRKWSPYLLRKPTSLKKDDRKI